MIIERLHYKPADNFLFTSSTHICTPIAERLWKSLAAQREYLCITKSVV